MAYSIYTVVGAQPIATTYVGVADPDTGVTMYKHPFGTIVRGFDPTYGEGEFIYLLGVASTTVGSVVTYDASTHQTVLCAVGGNIPRPIAIAMSANVAASGGWYQIGGIAVVAKSCTISMNAGVALGVLTTGLIALTGSGKEIMGATAAAIASATAGRTTALVMIDRPHKQGRVS